MAIVAHSVVVTPATSELLTTLAAVKLELNITGTGDDNYLNALIVQASSAISTYCGYTFGVETLRDTFRDSVSLGTRFWIGNRLDLPHNRAIILRKRPVIALTSVVMDGTTYVDGTDYYIDKSAGILTAMVNGTPTDWTMSLGVVEYTAGYVLPANPPSTLPGVLERACIDLIKLGWVNKTRDPQLRSEQIMDIVTRTWFPTTSETSNGLPTSVSAQLDAFREPIIA